MVIKKGSVDWVDFTQIKTYPIRERRNKFELRDMIPLDHAIFDPLSELEQVAEAILAAKRLGGKTILMMGGAVIKTGCSLLLIDLMERGLIDHLATNGAVPIHDFEVALIGATSEEVVNGLEDGWFGMVEETGRYLNEAIIEGFRSNDGYGASIGRMIDRLRPAYRAYSLVHTAYRLGIPVTVHVAIGGDIIHQHPTCDGAALGATSYHDFKRLTASVAQLTGGVLLNVGSAVNLPEVFLKALTIARNLRHDVRDFTVANFDFLDMYRPRTRLLEWPKRLGCRTFDIRLNHNRSLPTLHRRLTVDG
jgi:hypothetical protein